MSALQNNVDALREQLAKQEALLEQQKREDERIMREAREKEDTSWEHNIALLKSIFEPHQIRGEKEIAKFKKDYGHQLEQLNNAKNNVPGWGKISEPAWKKQVSNCQKRYDKEISRSKVGYEKDTALYHLFKRLDDRLTHIEQILIDDIKKEEFLENKPQSPHLSQNYKTTKLTGHQPTPVFTTSTLLGRKITYSNANTGLSLETREAMTG